VVLLERPSTTPVTVPIGSEKEKWKSTVAALAVFGVSTLSATAQIAANKAKDFMAVAPSQ
jgi:hypothetical protein